MLPKSLINDIKRFGVEDTDSGLFVPKASIMLSGAYYVKHYIPSTGEILSDTADHNLITKQGLNHVLNVVFNGASQVATWRVGIFKNNYTPLATDTLAGGFLTSAGEATAATDYSESTRVEYNEATSTAESITNAANVATFTILTTFTAYGAFLCSASSGSTGTLISAGKFSASKNVENGEALDVTYVINASSV